MGPRGWFVWRIDPGEIAQYALLSAPIEALGISGFAGLAARVEIDFDVAVWADDVASQSPVGGVRSDHRDDGCGARVIDQVCDLCRAPNVFRAVESAESEITAEPASKVVTVQHEGHAPTRLEPVAECPRERRLA